MEMNKTLASSGGRITVIDALRGFSLIGICLIHGMQHFGAMGTMAPQAMFPWEGTLDEIFLGVWQVLHYIFLPVWFELLYPDGPGSSKRC